MSGPRNKWWPHKVRCPICGRKRQAKSAGKEDYFLLSRHRSSFGVECLGSEKIVQVKQRSLDL